MEENETRKIEELEERVAELERKLNETLEERVADLEVRCKNNKALWDGQLKINALFIGVQSMIDIENKIKSGEMKKNLRNYIFGGI